MKKKLKYIKECIKTGNFRGLWVIWYGIRVNGWGSLIGKPKLNKNMTAMLDRYRFNWSLPDPKIRFNNSSPEIHTICPKDSPK